MKSRTLTLITAITLFAALIVPVQLAAQHTRFKLIDLGTLGGTNSYQTAPGRTVNNRGEVIAFADTDVPDPNAPNCLQPDCLISYAVKGHKGRRTNLGALPVVKPLFFHLPASRNPIIFREDHFKLRRHIACNVAALFNVVGDLSES